jgi:hypothetical protein
MDLMMYELFVVVLPVIVIMVAKWYVSVCTVMKLH